MSFFQSIVDEVMGTQAEIRKKELLPGDIISINSKGTIRYAIYLGDDEVIHCTESSNVAISSLSLFLTDQTKFSILNFERFNQDLTEKNGRYFLPSTSSPGGFDVKESSEQPFSLFSVKDTVNRALSLLNDQNVKLEINSCHHLFCWAKTGSKDCSSILLEKYWDIVVL